MPLNEAEPPPGIEPAIWAEHCATRAAADARALADINRLASAAQAAQDAPPSPADLLLMQARSQRQASNSYGLTATGLTGRGGRS